MEREKMRTWAEVDLDNIRHNVQEIKSAMPKGVKMLGVVKANAYGHGALPVTRAVLDAGAEYLAVASLSEAEELRAGGVTAPILILGVTPAAFAENLRGLNVTQAVGSLHYARELSENLTAPLKVHMKLDTGMSRTGFDTVREAAFGDIVEALSLPKLDFEGVFTHFAVSDVCGDGFTQVQYERFASAVARAEKTTGHSFAIKHCANSGAVINYKQLHCDMVRPGVITYGMYPDKEHGGLDLRPAMEVKSRVYAITTHEAGDTVSYGRTFTAGGHTRLAVVPIGYADGLHRVLSNKLEVLIRGRRCRQVGRICMDMCMVDITDLPECREGDIVTIIGRDGDEVILADELAEKAGTINYEITCAFTNRVPRLYV